MSTTQAMGQSQVRHLPGDLAMWIFILAELTVFAVLFVLFAATRRINEAQFLAGQASLHVGAGLINTLALLTSSYLVVRAVAAIRRSASRACANWLWLAMLAACVYLVSKGWEYQLLFAAGYDLDTNTFYTLYFFTTMFHFMHVLLGMVVLGAVAVKCRRGDYSADNHAGVESGASYWHMVDLVWVMLFPLVYVLH